jgi:putative DNA primase/helicase
MNLSNFPKALLEAPLWCAWRPAAGKKIPVSVAHGGAARVNVEADFVELDKARAWLEQQPGLAGLGILLKPPFIGIDIDNKGGPSLANGLTPDMQAWLDKFPGAYAELSPSGTGLHILGKGVLQEDWPKRRDNVEVYQHKRFFTVTGHCVRPQPNGEMVNLTNHVRAWAVNERQPSLPQGIAVVDSGELLRRASADSKLLSLWGGKWDGYDSQSNADFALCLKLAFYTGGDLAAMAALFRQSGLMRDKWDERHGAGTYGETTLQRALKTWNGKAWAPNPESKSDKEHSGGVTRKVSNTLTKQSLMGAHLARVLGNDLAFDPGREDWLDNDGRGLWRYINKRQALARINAEIAKEAQGEGYSAGYLTGVATFLEFSLSRMAWNGRQDLLPFQNGCLSLASGAIIPHSLAHNLTWQVPYDYQKTADCPRIEAWLRGCVEGHTDQFMLLMSFLRAVLLGRADLQRYLEIIGPGGTGKSTFIRLAEQLVGYQNCHSTELKHLENNRFETAKLYGKRLVTITDSQNYAGDVSILKAITGGDSLRFEEKNKQAGMGFRFGGMLIIAANEPIASKDYTSGLFRRRITVNFNRLVKPEERRDLDSEFAEELPGLVNYLLEIDDATMVAMLRDTATAAPTLASTTRGNLLATNPLAQWLDECCVHHPGAETPIGTAIKVDGKLQSADYWLYPNYIQFCEATGIKPLALNRFVGLLVEVCQAQLGLDVARTRNRYGKFLTNLRCRIDGEETLSPLDKKYSAP